MTTRFAAPATSIVAPSRLLPTLHFPMLFDRVDAFAGRA
jgi:hypothetical protein